MDYPTVTVRIEETGTTADVDIAPKAESAELVTGRDDAASPAEPPRTGLPTWMHQAG